MSFAVSVKLRIGGRNLRPPIFTYTNGRYFTSISSGISTQRNCIFLFFMCSFNMEITQDKTTINGLDMPRKQTPLRRFKLTTFLWLF